MIDSVQAVLLFVIVLLTILLLILGVQVFFILRDLRKTVARANKVLENTEVITETVTEPISFLSALLFGSRSLSSLVKSLKSRRKNNGETTKPST